MHPQEVRQAALALIAAGINDCEIARRLGVARTTIRDWRRPTYIPRGPTLCVCPRCWRPAKPMRFTPEDYAELLGLYLGDGCISKAGRTERLRISLDDKYPGIIRESRELIERCFPCNSAAAVNGGKGACSVVSVYCQHLGCLFPQYGPGLKHDRRIELERWQRSHVQAAPWSLLRGLIRSDGSHFINRTGPYEYLSYEFSNRSRDIVDIFLGACRLVELHPRSNYLKRRGLWQVRLNRRADVGRLISNVGLKE